MRPEDLAPLWQKARRGGWALLALSVLFVLSFIPLPVPGLASIRPLFLLAPAYYWAIVRPSLLPAPAAFALGLLLDLMSGGPFGLQAGLLTAAHGLARGQRKFLLGQSFLVIWAGFALVAGASALVQWTVFALFHLDTSGLGAALMAAALLTLLFPLLVPLLGKIARPSGEDDGGS